MRAVSTLLILALLAALSQSAWAQGNKDKAPTCRVRVRIVNYNWENPSSHAPDKFSANQMEWWLKQGQKKFPGVCLTTTPGEADYLIAWSETFEERTYTHTVPKTETTQHSGTIDATTNSTSTSTTGPGAVYTSGSASGTYSGTSTKTTYEERQREYSIWYVNSFVHKMTGEIGKREAEKIPVYLAKHKGQLRWSKPDKDAFVKAIKYVRKQTK